MVKEILSLIGKLMDKYGNTLLLAFVAGILTISKAPKDWINMLPFGTQNIYWGWAVCVVAYILIINYFRHAYRSFKRKLYLSKSSEEYHKKQNQEAMQILWDQVDGLSEADRADLRKFIETNNQPISKGGYFSYDSLYQSDWVVSMEKRTPKTTTAIDYTTGKEVTLHGYDTHVYKLKEPIFLALKYSMETYGRIGNFE